MGILKWIIILALIGWIIFPDPIPVIDDVIAGIIALYLMFKK